MCLLASGGFQTQLGTAPTNVVLIIFEFFGISCIYERHEPSSAVPVVSIYTCSFGA